MKSMTGFGSAEISAPSGAVACELKSYNNRFLDISVYLPSYLGRLEPVARSWIAERVHRGSVELSVKLRDVGSDVAIIVDSRTASAYVDAFEELRRIVRSKEKIRLSELASFEGVFTLERGRDEEGYWPLILPVLETAFTRFEDSRVKEGLAAEADILRQIDRVETAAALFRRSAPDLEAHIRGDIRKRFEEVMGNAVDENRVLAEVAVLLVKYSINEEIVRLGSHCVAFRAALAEEPCGKKLDFICQEINREANTIGSKCALTDVGNAVIEVKDAVENIREQLRNVE
jgi:uncharacterized protein (TIGR00255 family)